MRLGILGGSFDPIHWGHLGAAIEATHQLGLDRTLLVTAGEPPHKQTVAPARHRFAMTGLGALESERLEASALELERPGPHYTVDTLRQLEALHPGAELVLLVGSDAGATLEGWREPDELRRLARIVTVVRAGTSLPDGETMYGLNGGRWPIGGAPEPEYDGLVRRGGPLPASTREVRWPGVAISSTEVRRRVRAGAPIDYLVPRSVANYLRSNSLYS